MLIEAAFVVEYFGPVDESKLLKRIIINPAIFGGKPIIRGHRLAVEHEGSQGVRAHYRHKALLIEAAGPAKYSGPVDESELLKRITVNPTIFGGKPIVRGHRLAVEHVLGMLAAGDTAAKICEGYAWMQPEDVQACLVYARRVVGQERIEPLFVDVVA